MTREFFERTFGGWWNDSPRRNCSRERARSECPRSTGAVDPTWVRCRESERVDLGGVYQSFDVRKFIYLNDKHPLKMVYPMRPVRTRISHINISKWFPANDPTSTSVARLCVLREDLYLEIKGMVDEPLRSLDECSEDWRSIYFFRNSIRTFREIRSATETLKLN